ERRAMLIRNLRQFVARDHQNQTAWLQLPESSRWYWYGSENEAMAIFLKLLLRTNPTDPDAPAMVKYLLNNRSSNNRWESTRDTAMVVEAFVEYLKATGEDKPDMTVEIVVDNEVRKSVRITSENLFSFDNTLLLQGDELTAGEHVVELRRSGAGPVYLSGWMTNFSLEEQIAATGLEVRVNRRFYVLEPEQNDVTVRGSRGQAVQQQTGRFRRIPLDPETSVPSGTLVEVELLVESKNDYEYLLLEDHKPAGCEPDDQLSGYVFAGLHAYREFRDDRVCFFIPSLARGQHSLSYRVRAETPGQVSALPATIEGVYAPELIGNSDEMKLQIKENE
ncbi:MAG: alpha-2-macroglobulin, partial [Planctomycetaceae bacterium]